MLLDRPRVAAAPRSPPPPAAERTNRSSGGVVVRGRTEPLFCRRSTGVVVDPFPCYDSLEVQEEEGGMNDDDDDDDRSRRSISLEGGEEEEEEEQDLLLPAPSSWFESDNNSSSNNNNNHSNSNSNNNNNNCFEAAVTTTATSTTQSAPVPMRMLDPQQQPQSRIEEKGENNKASCIIHNNNNTTTKKTGQAHKQQTVDDVDGVVVVEPSRLNDVVSTTRVVVVVEHRGEESFQPSFYSQPCVVGPLKTLTVSEKPLHFAPAAAAAAAAASSSSVREQQQQQQTPGGGVVELPPTNQANIMDGPDHTPTQPLPLLTVGETPQVEKSISSSRSSSTAWKPPSEQTARIMMMRPLPSPSWTELSSQVLPAAARELLSSSLDRICHTARLSYALTTQRQLQYKELGNPSRGYFRNNHHNNGAPPADEKDFLPPFSSLPWIERQMVHEWRTYNNNNNVSPPPSTQQQRDGHQTHPDEDEKHSMMDDSSGSNPFSDSISLQSLDSILYCVGEEEKKLHPSCDNDPDDDVEFLRARTLVPQPKSRPVWQHAEACFACYKPFGPTRLRHHCRLCGCSFCHVHSSHSHKLPHLGYQVSERVCDACQSRLAEHDLAERVAWRLARCRDFRQEALCPYFEIGVDTMHDMAIRLTTAALTMAKSIPLGAQATVAVETLEVLRRHGLVGIYTILLRQEFLAAADLLCKALGINRTAWPLSVHELSAAIFYALAQHRAYRGLNPELEHEIHGIRHEMNVDDDAVSSGHHENFLLATFEEEESISIAQLLSGTVPTETVHSATTNGGGPDHRNDRIVPVCDALPDATLEALIFYAPLALNFIYAEKEVDMQLLAAQQGWRLVYSHLHRDKPSRGGEKSILHDLPASAVFVHEKQRIVCLAIRGTATIHDVVTDIRQVPVPFPEPELKKSTTAETEDWTTVSNSQGLAVSGMAGAALNLYREHVDSLLALAQEGYQIRIVGHSLGGGVASLLGALLHHEFPALGISSPSHPCSHGNSSTVKERGKLENVSLRVYAYGTPACIDARLSDMVQPFVVTAVLHDDVVPRLSPSSCRGLLKHLLHIKDTWVKEMLPDDISAITERAKLVWAPRWREGFTLISTPSSSSIKRYCRKQYCNGKKQLLSMKERLIRAADELGTSGNVVNNGGGEQCEGKEDEDHSSCFLYTDFPSSRKLDDSQRDGSVSLADFEPHLLVDYIGGVDHGTIIDGDEFFEAVCGSLVEDENQGDGFQDAVDDLVRQQEKEKSYSLLQDKKHKSDGEVIGNSSSSDDEVPEAVVLAETPLPRLYVPGKIAHLYSHRGVYRAVYVPRSFREIRRISMAGNMLSDHKCKAYYEALLEVRTVRRAPEDPPRWTAFDEDDTCACCASRFTWASTSNSKAQEARDKHNCRSCGALVCDPCSANRVPLPSLGLTCPVRVCDRCYNDIDGINTNNASAAIPDDERTATTRQEESDAFINKKPERRRERRSQVVDELAGRITAPRLF